MSVCGGCVCNIQILYFDVNILGLLLSKGRYGQNAWITPSLWITDNLYLKKKNRGLRGDPNNIILLNEQVKFISKFLSLYPQISASLTSHRPSNRQIAINTEAHRSWLSREQDIVQCSALYHIPLYKSQEFSQSRGQKGCNGYL